MKPFLACMAILVSWGAVSRCSSVPGAATDTVLDTSASPTATPYVAQPGDDQTPPDFVPNFKGVTFNSYPFHNVSPRTVQITLETVRNSTERASNRAQVEEALRAGLESALKRSRLTAAASSANKIHFTLKDCRNVQNTADCVALDAVFQSPKFELEVGGYSQSSSDLSRAYSGAINAVMERLNKQLEIVGSHQ